ncbi:nicotinate-nicotinamide nucleotide adenylyltransferase [Acinetobacter puyangensis]|uniref:nicotinate-nicotinamide nucleotide adenylyltransferase n=1 Tax=Acinetobacter puyangensis TaxID=1096779 RepID=UPI003A4D8AA0
MLGIQKKFDYLVFIGRFQPFHFAHKEVIDIAFDMSKNVILVLGSAQNERTIKNPFSIAEREQMILGNFNVDQQRHLFFVPIIDLYNDKKWVKAVTDGVKAVTDGVTAVTGEGHKVGLIGHFKDESSYYLRLFPEWELVELDNLKNALSATPLREKYYRGEIDREHFPDNVQQFLQQFKNSEWYPKLQQYYLKQDLSVVNQQEA